MATTQAEVKTTEKKEMWIAVVLSLLIFGAGYLYLDKARKFFVYFISFIVFSVLIILCSSLTYGVCCVCGVPLLIVVEILVVYDTYLISVGRDAILPEF